MIENMYWMIFILTIISISASAFLGITYLYTEPFIKQVEQKRLKNGLLKIAPDADDFKLQENGDYDIIENTQKIGVIKKVYTKGYAGKINMLIGYSDKGKIIGIHILEHTETPGLGAKVNEIKPKENEPWFQKQFRGLMKKDIKLKRDGGKVDAITAATVTSRAVTNTVRNAVGDVDAVSKATSNNQTNITEEKK